MRVPGLRLAVAPLGGMLAIPFLAQAERIEPVGPVHGQHAVEMVDFVLQQFRTVSLQVGTWQAVRTGRGLQVQVAATAIFFGLWQTWTAVSLTVNDRDGLDLRRFLAYPLPPGRLYALGLATGVAGDPIAAFWALLLGGVFGGAALARPGAWLAVLALALLLFAVATVLYVALLQEALSVVLATRWVREWAMVLSVLTYQTAFIGAEIGKGTAIPVTMMPILGVLIVLAQGSAVAPFIYTLF